MTMLFSLAINNDSCFKTRRMETILKRSKAAFTVEESTTVIKHLYQNTKLIKNQGRENGEEPRICLTAGGNELKEVQELS